MATSKHSRISISIDRGGTFTDIFASAPGRDDIVLKILSVDPVHYPDAPTEGIRRVLELVTGHAHPRGQLLDLSHVERIRMGTTVGTNALLERKGARSALLVTKGFKDLLKIGNQSRPSIFDLTVARPELLYQNVVEVDERVTLEDATELPVKGIDVTSDDALRTATTGEVVRILKAPDTHAVIQDLQRLWQDGYRSISLVFLHSYLYPYHEQVVGDLAHSMGFSVVQSSALQPMIRAVPRGMSATADAYLTPIIKSYIDSISQNFQGGLGSVDCRCEFMQSDGGLVDFRRFSGLKSILSGPAGGVVGYAQTTWDSKERKPVIGFDMGGTSTDCSRFGGTFDHVFESVTAGISVQSPQLDIKTVAAGGGSMLFWKDGLFVVGPESAGAHPGPACYKKGGPLAVTDANLFLGRIQPEFFPKIFGPNEDEPLGIEIVHQKFSELTERINRDNRAEGKPQFTPEEVALGFLRVADEVMARPVRALTEAQGYDTSDHVLASFGGAGGQHACSLASALSIDRVIIHKYSSILSAYGLSLGDVVHDIQHPAAIEYNEGNTNSIQSALASLVDEADGFLVSQGLQKERIRFQKYLNMRYEGSTTSFMILQGQDAKDVNFKSLFEERHLREFGFVFPHKKVLVDDFRVRGIGSTASAPGKSPFQQLQDVKGLSKTLSEAKKIVSVYFASASHRQPTPLYVLGDLQSSMRIPGPAIILDATQTILVVPNSVATILDSCVVIDLNTAPKLISSSLPFKSQVNPIQLSIFGHRFMSVAEHMGRTLQKTAVSTNIKERLDFSCALFSPDGGLVANAPHVPVHLGSMQFAVRYQHKFWAGRIQDGDVLISNHPSAGGTHLPDITVITPVFAKGTSKIVFYVASRGHHADIGGILPGSMPPNSTHLQQEGAAIIAEKLVSNGVFNEQRITELVFEEPARHPGCSGTRCLRDNISDLQAQVAANNEGIQLIQAMIAEHGLDQVHMYMTAIQDTSAAAVRNLLRSMQSKTGGRALQAIDYMDDGTPICLKITIDDHAGTATFDFTGSGPQVYGNTNAPVAITHSAIIYCLRSLVASDIPLNEGCLSPISIIIPPASILSPGPDASVVGGNVLTSQRITDVVLQAFNACADSQGCMNNLTFGVGSASDATETTTTNVKTSLDRDSASSNRGFGYYETIAGGAGAGPTWNGASGVHTHMTNTRITDPEILEKRYPVILHRFEIREGSGGEGLFKGGDGVIRDLEFRVPMSVSALTERRARAPNGRNGGGNGKMGKNLWIRHGAKRAHVDGTVDGENDDGDSSWDEKSGHDDHVVSLGGKASLKVEAGDRIVLMTPGGGGWGYRNID